MREAVWEICHRGTEITEVKYFLNIIILNLLCVLCASVAIMSFETATCLKSSPFIF